MTYKKLSRPAEEYSVTVTFHYPDEWRVVVAANRAAAFAEARAKWGDGWEGEPTVSTPETIYRDLIGDTRAQHGQDLGTDGWWASRRDRYRRTGRATHGAGAA